MGTLVKQLKPSDEVDVIYDTPKDYVATTTTASVLAKAGFGECELESDEGGSGGVESLVVKTLEDYNIIRHAAGCKQVETIMGRPPKAEDKRASETIQLRVTAAQKAAYSKAAWRSPNLSDWIKSTLDAAAKAT
jgi:hypothetical protein